MNKNDFQQLAEKISNGIATEKEVALYNYYYNRFQEDVEWDESALGKEYDAEKELYARIIKDLPVYRSNYKKIPYIKIAAAAAILIIVSIGLIRNQEPEIPSQPAYTKQQHVQDVDPGTNKAILTLSDGTVLNLDESQEGILAQQGGARVKKTEEGKIAYTAMGNQLNENAAAEPVFNKITVPEGGQCQLTLPDGSKVWLNSSSSLKFPVAFTKESREVELEGEAYFEVVSLPTGGKKGIRKRSFIVKTPTQQIEVLGTQFNVNAYSNENLVKTTLIEGAVKISSVPSGAEEVLKPGQQAQLTNTGDILVVSGVDTEEATAWKDGMFYFNNTELSAIMRHLSRWYNVEIDIKDMPQKRFNGELSRDVKLSQVLQMMEKTSGLKFKVEERRVSMIK
ncbi:FecR family protein [Olivibacter sitiensis]|uniref:FecR family protein n=1 Tax=Olivibacter sitiensis TaxID=376470 RepID=UPI0004095F1D|nr:FecR domain-containing protein [Olivibacter sitiensis]